MRVRACVLSFVPYVRACVFGGGFFTLCFVQNVSWPKYELNDTHVFSILDAFMINFEVSLLPSYAH